MKNDWGFEFGGLLSGSYKTHTYPCPHSSYAIIDNNDSIGGLGADILKLVPVGKLSPYIGVGVYWYQYQVVAKSTVTGYLYRQSLSTRFCLAYSAGSKIQLSDRWEFGVGYHSERGINVQVGYNFKK